MSAVASLVTFGAQGRDISLNELPLQAGSRVIFDRPLDWALASMQGRPFITMSTRLPGISTELSTGRLPVEQQSYRSGASKETPPVRLF
jgi:hypothetical protein